VLSIYLQDVKINSCRILRIALEIQEEILLMFIPKLVHVKKYQSSPFKIGLCVLIPCGH
jgi:putative effector of murein hydrolase LrgA (UPF0299 family)